MIKDGDGTQAEPVYKNLIEEYSKSLDRQRETIDRIQNKAIEVIKVNFLVIGALVAGSSYFLNDDQPLIILVSATALCFVYSTWASLQTYSSSTFFKHGFGFGDIDLLETCKNELDYYKVTSKSYNYWIGINLKRYSEPLQYYQKGLWAAFTGILIFSFVIIRVLLPPFLPEFDFVVIMICGVIGMYGYCSTSVEIPQFSGLEPPEIPE